MVESNFDFTNFFDMLDQHFNEQIQNVNYDKTILCTITNADNADDGEYTVTDGSSHFIAYSTSKYKVKDNVYVLIPEGDYNAAKQIIGKYSSSDSESVTYVAPFENYFDITGNLFEDEGIGEVGLLANDTTPDEAEGFVYVPFYKTLTRTNVTVPTAIQQEIIGKYQALEDGLKSLDVNNTSKRQEIVTSYTNQITTLANQLTSLTTEQQNKAQAVLDATKNFTTNLAKLDVNADDYTSKFSALIQGQSDVNQDGSIAKTTQELMNTTGVAVTRVYNEEFRGNTLYHYLGSYELDVKHSAGFEYLGVKGDFRSYVTQAITGDYGIELVVTYVTEDGAVQHSTLRLNSTDMWGNPYNFGSAFTQQQVFDISSYAAVKQIAAWFYESANFYSTNSTKIAHTKDVLAGTDENGNSIITQEELPDNLFLSNFYVSLGYKSDGAEKVTLYTRDTTTYSAKKTDDENAKTLRLRWTHILPDTSKTCVALTNYGEDETSESSVLKYITNYDGDKRKVNIHWYMYDKDSSDDLAGTYWKELFLDSSQTPINDFVYKLNLTTDFINTHSNLYFKVIVELVNDEGIRKADKTCSEALAQFQAQLTSATLVLNEYQAEKSVIEAKRNNLKDDNFAVYDSELMEINTQITDQEEEIAAIQKKINKLSVNYSSYYTYLKTDILEFTNETDTQSTGTVDYVSGLGIQVIKKDSTGQETVDTGVYRIYDTLTNDLINAVDEYTYRTLRMSFTSLMANNTNSGDISQIKWYIPKNNTMIAAPEFGKTYNTENTGETITEEDGYYVITRTNSEVINATVGDTLSTIYGTTDQQFRIKRHLLQSSINNTVKCEILRNGTPYTAEITLEFANSGSNGTNNTLILKLDKEYVAEGKYKAYASYDQLVKEASEAAKSDFEAVGKNIPYDKTVTYYYLDSQGIYRPYLYSTDVNWEEFLKTNKVYTNGQAYIAKTNTNRWELPSKTISSAREKTLWTQTVPTGKDITISYVSADVDCCDKNYENYVAPTVVLQYTDTNNKAQSITIQKYSNVAGTTWGVWPSTAEQGKTITAKGGTTLKLVSMGDSNNGRRWTYLYEGGCVIYSYEDLEANTDYTYKIYKYNGKDFIDTGRAYTDAVTWTSTDNAIVELMSSPPAWTGDGSDKAGADHYITLSAELYDTSDKAVEIDESKVVWTFFDQNDKGEINPGGFALKTVTTKETNDKGVEINKVEWRLYKTNNGVNAGCILQCTVNVGAKVGNEYPTTYTGYLPVAWRDSYDVEFSGADRIIYGTDGATPTYYREAYKLNGVTPTIARYCQIGQSITPITDDNRSLYFWLPTVTNAGLISPSSMFFNDEQYNVWVELSGGGYTWVQPILVIQNAWGSSLLNSWNGEIVTDNDKGTILATMVGAGSKDSNNKFNGVLMGNVAKGSADIASGYGLYGYKDGVQAYGLLTNGTAFLGKKGKAQLQFDGNSGRIENSSYQEDGHGMRLDFDGSDGDGSSFIDMKQKGESPEIRKIVKNNNKNVICYSDDNSDSPTPVKFDSKQVYYTNSRCTDIVTIPLTTSTWRGYTNNNYTVWGYGKVKNTSISYNPDYTYYTDAECTTRASIDLTKDIFDKDPTKYYYIFNGLSPDPFVSGRTYYTDAKLTKVATTAINKENYISGNYWVYGNGLASEFKVNEKYFEDEACQILAAGALNSDNWGKDKDGNTVSAYYAIQGKRVIPDTSFDENETYYSDSNCVRVATTDLTEETAVEGTTYYWLGLKEIKSASTAFNSSYTYRNADESAAQGRITYDTYTPNTYYYIVQEAQYSYNALSKNTAYDANRTYYLQNSSGQYFTIRFNTQEEFEAELAETEIYVKVSKLVDKYVLDTRAKNISNKNAINNTVYYSDSQCTIKALGAITEDNYKDTITYYIYAIKEVKYYKGNNQVDFSRDIFLDANLTQRATGKLIASKFDPNNNTYFTKVIITIIPSTNPSNYDRTITYYSDAECTTVATGAINPLNFTSAQYYIKTAPVISVTWGDAKVDRKYYVDATCTIEATGPITKGSYKKNTYYAKYTKQCVKGESFVSGRTYYLDENCTQAAVANWSTNPTNLYHIVNQEFKTNRDNFDSRLTYYTDSSRTTIVGTALTSATYGTNLPYYIKTGEVVESDARVKISTTSPYLLVQNANGEKVIKVEKEQAQICGWTMTEDTLHNKNTYLYAADQADSKTILDHSAQNWRITTNKNFGVDSEGHLYADGAYFKGHIDASSISGGSIDAAKINGGSIDAATITGGSIAIGENFKVNEFGNLTAINGTFNGTITSSAGQIGGWSIGSTTLTGGGVILDAAAGSITGAHISGGTVEASQLSLNGIRLGWKQYQVITTLSGEVTVDKFRVIDNVTAKTETLYYLNGTPENPYVDQKTIVVGIDAHGDNKIAVQKITLTAKAAIFNFLGGIGEISEGKVFSTTYENGSASAIFGGGGGGVVYEMPR